MLEPVPQTAAVTLFLIYRLVGLVVTVHRRPRLSTVPTRKKSHPSRNKILICI